MQVSGPTVKILYVQVYICTYVRPYVCKHVYACVHVTMYVGAYMYKCVNVHGSVPVDRQCLRVLMHSPGIYCFAYRMQWVCANFSERRNTGRCNTMLLLLPMSTVLVAKEKMPRFWMLTPCSRRRSLRDTTGCIYVRIQNDYKTYKHNWQCTFLCSICFSINSETNAQTLATSVVELYSIRITRLELESHSFLLY